MVLSQKLWLESILASSHPIEVIHVTSQGGRRFVWVAEDDDLGRRHSGIQCEAVAECSMKKV